jgi:23S rRNA (adenine2503-C2)-methyltransferase
MPPVTAMFTQTRFDVADAELSELEEALESLGRPRFHARQIFQWVYKRGVTDFALMSDLARDLRSDLASSCAVVTPIVERQERSEDGTTKFLLRLADGKHIESVFIPDTPAQTFCISTQVGCAMKCAFCLTGKMGIDRNLTAGEIAGQVRVLARELGMLDTRFNIVLMGMGEPLHNYEATMKALRIRDVGPTHDALNRRRPPGAGTAGDRTADAEPCHLAPCHDRRSTRPAGADQPQVRIEGTARRLPPLPAEASRAHHV